MNIIQQVDGFIKVEIDNLLWSFAICKKYGEEYETVTEFYYSVVVSDKAKLGSYHSTIDGDSIEYYEVAKARLEKDIPSLVEDVKVAARQNNVSWVAA